MIEKTPSLNLLGGAAKHTEHYALYNHNPEMKAWAMKHTPSENCRAMVAKFMGYDFPIETIAPEIINSLEFYGKYGVEIGLMEYFKAIGPRGVALLKAIRRNFQRKKELWLKVRS